MESKKIRQALFDLQKELNQLSGKIDDLAKMIPPDAESHFKRPFQMPALIRQARALLGTGLTTWEVAEKMADYFDGSKWDAYFTISRYNQQKAAQKRYARAYLIRALSDNGFSFSQISPIAGCSRQRCQQIIKQDFI